MIQPNYAELDHKRPIAPDKVLNAYSFDSIYPPVGNMRWLENLAKVNVFVGPNNSGKSRLIRELAYSMDSYSFHPQHLTVEQLMELSRIIEKYNEEFTAIKDNCLRNGNGPFPVATNPPHGSDFLSTEDSFLAVACQHIESVKTAVKSKDQLDQNSSSTVTMRGLLSRLENLVVSMEAKIKAVISDYGHQDHYHRVYIPVLRGLKTLEGNSSDPYWSRTKSDYFSKPDNLKKDFEIFTGYNMYDQLQKMLSGKGDKRELLKRFEIFLSESFFDGKKVTLIPLIDEDAPNNKDVHIKIGDEDDYSIANLGDGIQQIIIQTFPLFRDVDKQLLVFIEEPELFLHPGMQRILLNLFVELPNHQFFLTTHSNHFLDITLDVGNTAIFNVQKELIQKDGSSKKENKFQLANVSRGDRSSLQLLGVSNSSVFLTNATIWVEGITDRMYLRNYFKIFQEDERKKRGDLFRLFKEDVHFSFVEYAGSNITHWSFGAETEDPINIKWLCAEAFLLVDKDKAEWKKERAKKMKEKLGASRFSQTIGVEIENTISAKVLRKTISTIEGIDEADLPSFSDKDYKNVPLGIFIEETLLKGKATHKYKSSKTDTIDDKLSFCKKCIENTDSPDDLSKETVALCKKIHKFIAEQNPR